MHIWRTVRSAFGNWWSAVGIVAASITGFNLLRRFVQIDLSRVFAEIMAGYEKWIRDPVSSLLADLSINVSPWQVDFLLMWGFLGGIVCRAAWAFRQHAGALHLAYGPWRFFLLAGAWIAPFFALFCVVLWPIAAVYLIRDPYFTVYDARSVIPSYQEDARQVLALQFSAAIVCVGGWAFINAIALQQ